MSTALVLSNNKLLVNIDYDLQLKDLYFPYIGQENHLNKYLNKMFLYFDGKFHDVNSNEWIIKIEYFKESMIGISSIEHKTSALKIEFEDYISPRNNIYIREFKVINLGDHSKEVYLYFQNNFSLAESDFADTVVWYQPIGCLIQYKKDRYIGCGTQSKFYQFSCAAKSDNKGLGVFPNLNGSLNFNPVSTGNVNSCVSFKFNINAHSSFKSNIYYTCAENLEGISKLSKYLNANSLEVIKNKVIKNDLTFISKLKTNSNLKKLDKLIDADKVETISNLYLRSHLIVRSQIDSCGAIIAANDGQYLKSDGTDSYSYFWPRDGANITLSMITSNLQSDTEKYFNYIFNFIENKGYFLHKYFPSTKGKNKFLGSSWHPWVSDLGNTQLPIQEDATALNLYVFAAYIEKFSSYQLLSKYWPKIKNMIKFLMNYTFRNYDEGTNINRYVEGFVFDNKDPYLTLKNSYLPLPSYDIWEQYYGVFTYTAVTVYAALQKAVNILEIKGEHKLTQKVINFLPKLKNDIEKYLFDDSSKKYIKGIRSNTKMSELIYDKTADSSLFALSQFNFLAPDDPKLINTLSDLISRLSLKTSIGGLARKENDHYLKLNNDYTGNPWFLPIFWKAQNEISKNKLNEAINTLDWVLQHTDQTGLMAEQVDPYSGYGLSVKPLTWNHAEFIQTINLLLERI